MPHRLRDLVAERARHRCEYCLAPEVIFNSPHDVEHVRPRVLGGTDEEWNLALACQSCNAGKHSAVTARDPISGHVVRLFDPRVDGWDDHFELRPSTAEIAGLTEIGRATVIRLRMNGPRQREARRLWIAFFSFPRDPRDALTGIEE